MVLVICSWNDWCKEKNGSMYINECGKQAKNSDSFLLFWTEGPSCWKALSLEWRWRGLGGHTVWAARRFSGGRRPTSDAEWPWDLCTAGKAGACLMLLRSGSPRSRSWAKHSCESDLSRKGSLERPGRAGKQEGGEEAKQGCDHKWNPSGSQTPETGSGAGTAPRGKETGLSCLCSRAPSAWAPLWSRAGQPWCPRGWKWLRSTQPVELGNSAQCREVTGEGLEATPTVPTWAVGTSPKGLSWAYSRTSSQDPRYCWDILARPENQLVLRNPSLPGASH